MTYPTLLDETGQKILAAINRIKNKLLGTSEAPVDPGAAAISGREPEIQDSTGREIIAALNGLGDGIPIEIQYLAGVTSNIQDQLDGKQPSGSYKTTQTAVPDPGSSGSADSFIATLSQDANGEISVTKSQVQAASETQRGVVTTGGQTFAGQKTFADWPRLSNTTSSGVGIDYYYSDKAARFGYIYMGWNSGSPRYGFHVFSTDGSGVLSHYERFFLPAVDQNRTSDGTFNILTSKTIGFTQVYNASSIAASRTKTFSLANSARGFLYTTGAYASSKGLYIINVTSTGSVTYTPVLAASALTLTTSSNTLTLAASSSSATVFATFIMTNGTVTE